MGRDRNFPTFFSKVHAKRFTPHLAILGSLMIVVMMSISLEIEDVASAADIMFLLLFLQVNVTLIRLRKKRPDLDRGFFTPLFPWLTILGIGLLLFLALYMFAYSPLGWLVTAGWIGAGLLVYQGYASKREVQHVHKVRALERLERKEYSILVAISKPSALRSLLELAAAIAKKHHGEIILLHVIEVSENQPLRAGLVGRARITPLVEEAEAILQRTGIPARSVIRISHRISRGIVETAIQENCNLLLLGRQQNPTFMERLFSSLIDSVLQESPCETVVLHGDLPPNGIRNILIPFGHNVHTRLAIEIAPALSEHFACITRVVVVFEPGVPLQVRQDQENRLRKVIKLSGLEALVEVVHDSDILPGVLHQAKSADLIVMGGRTGDFLELLLGQSLTQEITEQAPCPVLWLKEYEEPESFWAGLFRRPYAKELESNE